MPRKLTVQYYTVVKRNAGAFNISPNTTKSLPVIDTWLEIDVACIYW